MSKSQATYACSECGALSYQWGGLCKDCGAWNTLTEVIASQSTRSTTLKSGYAGQVQAQVIPLAKVAVAKETRFSSGLDELDRVLGGGIVEGSVVLIGGDPGIGKSTILLQTLTKLSAQHKTLYISGEESPQQIKMRADRLGLKDPQLSLLAATNLEVILHQLKAEAPTFIVLDSIQTMHTDEIQSAPGSVSQVRECAAKVVQYAKQTGTAVFLVGHVTKEGALAGPRVLEHMVDTVLYFEGGAHSRFRLIRAVKNRFGAVNELGVFAMSEQGLKEVKNPSAIFLSQDSEEATGRVVMATWEGSRPMLVEVQALVDESHLANPRRVTVGLDHNRLSMLLAVLNRHGQVVTANQDVFVNVVGGMKVTETASDVPVLLSVLSSLRDKPLPQDMIAFGEIGLSGEIRPSQSGQERIKEAVKLGFKTAIVPAANAPKGKMEGIEVLAVSKLEDLMQVF